MKVFQILPLAALLVAAHASEVHPAWGFKDLSAKFIKEEVCDKFYNLYCCPECVGHADCYHVGPYCSNTVVVPVQEPQQKCNCCGLPDCLCCHLPKLPTCDCCHLPTCSCCGGAKKAPVPYAPTPCNACGSCNVPHGPAQPCTQPPCAPHQPKPVVVTYPQPVYSAPVKTFNVVQYEQSREGFAKCPAYCPSVCPAQQQQIVEARPVPFVKAPVCPSCMNGCAPKKAPVAHYQAPKHCAAPPCAPAKKTVCHPQDIQCIPDDYCPMGMCSQCGIGCNGGNCNSCGGCAAGYQSYPMPNKPGSCTPCKPQSAYPTPPNVYPTPPQAYPVQGGNNWQNQV